MELKPTQRFVACAIAVWLAPPLAVPTHAGSSAAGDEDQTEVRLPDTRILSLSPDGRLLAARGTAPWARELCVYEVATQTEQACADLEERQLRLSDESVVWSPDSTRIAFSEDTRLFVDGDLWVMDVATAELTNLTEDGYEGGLFPDDSEQPDGPINVDVLPAWAPDGRSIAFLRSPFEDGVSDGSEIASVDLASGEVSTLTSLSPDLALGVKLGPVWAPDGRRLYYSVAMPSQDDLNGVWAYDPATGDTRQILSNDAENGPPLLVEVATTGATGLVVYPFLQNRLPPGNDAFRLLDLDTNTVSALDPSTDRSPSSFTTAATFSPDGAQVLYGIAGPELVQFFVRAVADGKSQPVAPGVEGQPFVSALGGVFWASDGSAFVATELDEGVVLDLGSLAS